MGRPGAAALARNAPPPLDFWWPGQGPAPRRRKLIIDGLVGRGELGVIYGPPGGGKSALLVDLLAHIAVDRPWHGRAVWSGPSLLIAAERRDLSERRLLALADRLECPVPDLPVAIMGGRLDLAVDRDAVDRVVATAAAVEDRAGSALQIIAVDTMSRAAPSLDENDTRAMALFVDRLSQIAARTGAAVVLVSHETKATGSLRGSSALLGAVDVAMRVSGGDRRVAEVTKANDGPVGPLLTFRLVPVGDGGDETVVVEPVVDGGRAGARGARPRAGGDRLRGALLDMLDAGPVDRADALRRLRDDGVLVGKPDATRIRFGRLVSDLAETGNILVDGTTLSAGTYDGEANTNTEHVPL